MSVQVLQGDCRDTLPTLATRSVQCAVTSPPYYGLRDYQTGVWENGDPACDHRNIRKKISASTTLHSDRPGAVNGLYPNEAKHRYDTQPYHAVCERCGAMRIDRQIGLEETPDAYIMALLSVFAEVWRVLRDDGTLWVNMGDSYANDGKWGGHTGGKHAYGLHGMPVGRHKQYTGFKPKDLMGMPWRLAFALQDAGWYLRSDIIWHKPNPMPESVLDRPTRAHEYIFLLAKGPTYYYDADAVREPYNTGSIDRYRYALQQTCDTYGQRKPGARAKATRANVYRPNALGRNRRDVWTVPSAPYPDAHFATFPPALIEPCILAGSRPGDTVLDPFGGSGTVGEVATTHHRAAILCELSPAYCDLIDKRLDGVPVRLPWEEGA